MSDFDDMNISELVYCAQEMNPGAHPGLEREILLAILRGEEVDLPERAVDKCRLQIMTFIDSRWDQVKPLLTCPAKTRDPRACFQCTDVQVAECAIDNKTKIFGEDEP